jgi:hypothetical protein
MLDMTAGGKSSNGGYPVMNLDNKSNSLYLSNKSGDRKYIRDSQSPNGSVNQQHANNASLMSPSINQTSRQGFMNDTRGSM